MKHPRITKVIIILTLLVAPVLAAPRFPSEFPDGANALFAGHSFFIPVAASFNVLATGNGYPSHQMDSVFSSGASGSPRQLWENEDKRQLITDKLSSGQVELFGLTSFGEVASTFEDYQRWFDLALTYNPDTTFYIGTPWLFGGPTMETATFDQNIEDVGEIIFDVVVELREAYPDNTIVYLNYGKVASIMKYAYEAGNLPDIKGLVPDPQNGVSPEEALFADSLMGHAGPMMTELCALTWISALYGADLNNLVYTDYQSDVDSIVNEALQFNLPYQHLPMPAIMINDTIGPAQVTTGTSIGIDIGLFSTALTEQPADWFMLVYDSLDIYSIDFYGQWQLGIDSIYQGPLFDFPPVRLLEFQDLQPGNYLFFFGVDTTPNGLLDGELFYDYVEVEVRLV